MTIATDLIQELRNRASAGDGEASAYAAKYETMRAFLEKNYYPYIQANCPWFTDHGKAHIEGVLWSSGQILQNRLSDPAVVTAFDIYLLATSIIWHDAGMVSKRRGHEQEVRKFLDAIAATAFDDVAEKRLVEEIIGAHTGRGTIQRLRQEERIGKYIAFPRALAGLLRFADEVSEDSSRISRQLLNNGSVPADHQIFWHYAACVKASHPDPSRERVILTIELDRADAVKELDLPQKAPNPSVKLSLINYVISRIEKVVCERTYCAPHFLRYSSIQSVEVRLSLVEGTARVPGYEHTLEFTGQEYPDIPITKKFFEEHPEWKAEELFKQPQNI